MARTAIIAQTTKGSYPTFPISPGNFDLTWTGTGDTTARYTPLVNSKTLVLAKNTDSTSRTITFTSQPDPGFNRTGDIASYAVGVGVTSMFGPFQTSGWLDSGSGGLDIDVSSANIQLAVITLP